MGQQANLGLCARRPEVEPADPCTKVGMKGASRDEGEELAEEEREGSLKGLAALKETGHWAEPVAMKEEPVLTGGFEN